MQLVGRLLNTNPFFSPDQFMEFVQPYLKEVVAAYRALDYYVIKHTGIKHHADSRHDARCRAARAPQH